MLPKKAPVKFPTLEEWGELPVDEKLTFFISYLDEKAISYFDLYALLRFAQLSGEVEFFGPIIRKLVEIELGKENPSLFLNLLEYYEEISGSEGAFYHTRRILNAVKRNGRHASISFSQEGEDLMIRKIFGNKSSGSFIDVGAYHPSQYSNTFSLYLSGWRGVNIEPNKDILQMFIQERPEDINLGCAVGLLGSSTTYFEYEEGAYNTFSEERVDSLKARGILPSGSRRISEKTPLSQIFEQYLTDRPVDLLDIDVEGLEEEILESADLSRWKPKLVLVEQIEREVNKIYDSSIYRYLSDIGYKLVAQTFSTCFYLRDA